MPKTQLDPLSYSFTCCHCGKIFHSDTYKKCWSRRRDLEKRGMKQYCSEKCRLEARGYNKLEEIECTQCGKKFKPDRMKEKRNKSSNRFCSHSCAAIYNNAHKTTGTRRSKLEKWLEEKLTELYPNLEIKYSDRTAINSELDIYIPSLQLAFELNGIFHYEPIYGDKKLNQTQINDANKFQRCQANGISLCVIDTSKQSYFKESTSKPYLDIITKIVDENLEVNKRYSKETPAQIL